MKTVLAHNRCDSSATAIVADGDVAEFLRENNPILNSDDSEWGQWEQVSVGGLTDLQADEFCRYWMRQ